MDKTMRSMSFSGMRVTDVRASQRQSFAGRVSHRVASGLSFADSTYEEPRTGTVAGTTINTLCSVIGAGVLSLPLALYNSSIFVGLAILAVLSSFAAFSVYCLVVGCDATGRYSITEVVAFALFPPQLWEEFLYQKGKEHAATEAPAHGEQQLHASYTGSGSDSSSNRGGAVKEGDAKATRTQGAQAKESANSRTGSDSRRSGRVSSEAKVQSEDAHHRRPLRPRQSSTTKIPVEAAASKGEEPVQGPSTSSYATLRDAYARAEWQKRRYRRYITAVMEFILFCNNYGTLIVYSKVIADSMPPVVAYVTGSDGIFVSKNFWLIAGGVVFFVLSCARNMEELKWTSLLGFLTIFYIVVLIIYRYHTSHADDFPHVDPKQHGTVRLFHLSVSVLQTVSTFGMAFSYHYNVPYFYKELQDRRPRRMMQSIGVAFPIIIACYALTGVFGYLTFGNLVADRKVGGNVVSNYPKRDLLMNIGRLGLFAHFACVFPVVSICTRRGLHRLVMIGLTWVEQSLLMMEAAKVEGAILSPAEEQQLADAVEATEEASGSSSANTPHTTPRAVTATAAGAARESGSGREKASSAIATASSPLPGETSPLLQSPGRATPGYEVFSKSSPQQNPNSISSGTSSHTIPTVAALPSFVATPLPTHASAAEQERAPLTDGFQAGTVDVDRDVGSPDLTTTLAIVIEAAFLVSTTVVIAATVSGIDFVIRIIGTLFSVFIVMVAPGMVGWCVFSPTGPFGSAAAAVMAYTAAPRGGYEDDETLGSADSAVNGASSRYRFIRLKQVLCVVDVVLGIVVTSVGIAVLVYDTIHSKPQPPMPP